MIDGKIISSLKSQLNTCNYLRTYANKFIAHASDNQGKLKLTERQKGITLNSLDEAYKSIIKCCSFVGAVILYEHSLGGIPAPQYNQFQNLEKAAIKSNDIPKLGDYWREREKTVNLWENDIWPSV